MTLSSRVTELAVTVGHQFKALRGEIEYRRRRMTVAHEVDPNNVLASPTKVKVPLPGPGGVTQHTHPSIVYVEDGWNGYTYWMAATPYPSADDAHEDPCIYVTNDPLAGWIVPPGQSNPIHDMPGKPLGGYNADVELYLGPDNRMHLWWKNNIGDVTEQILYTSSADGHTWATPKSMFSGPVGVAVSPCVAYHEGQWIMWSVNLHFVASGGDGVKRMERRTAPAPDGPWSTPTNCSFSPDWPSDRHPWHPNIIRYGSVWVGVMNDCLATSNGGQGDHYFITSRDGLNWRRGNQVLHPRTVAGEYSRLYRASIVPTTRDGQVGFDMWYSVVDNAFEWWVYRTRLGLVSPVAPPVGLGYGQWASSTATASDGTTTLGNRFYVEWANNVAVLHIDAMQIVPQSSAVSNLYGTLPPEIPAPRRVAELMIVPPTGVVGDPYRFGVYVFVRPDRQVRGVGVQNQRVIAHIVYHYD